MPKPLPSHYRAEHQLQEFVEHDEFPGCMRWDERRAIDLLWRYLDERASAEGEVSDG
jgi:hypothetical protein